MANDKDFIVKNAVEVSGSTKTTLGTVTNDDIDLSTGNYFAHSPSGATTYTISNAADVQSFQLEVTGGTAEVTQNFSTTTYTGNSATQTITNGIDLSGGGGLLWIKWRSGTNAFGHSLHDTERGVTKELHSDSTTAESTENRISSFNSDGFTLTSNTETNYSGDEYVSWTFKKAAGFFDVVTYTGTGSDQTINHSLGTTVGFMVVKRTDSTGNWPTWHHDLGDDHRMYLNGTASSVAQTQRIRTATTTTFTVGTATEVNASGGTYVAYLFAHDTASDGLIQCGSYTGNGSTSGPTITLGWQPQWLLIKNTTTSTSSTNWVIFDTARGITNDGSNDPFIRPNLSNAEASAFDCVDLTDTGFQIKYDGAVINTNGDNFIYIAIRNAADLDLTWPTSIEWAGGTTPAAPATGETDLFSISTDDGGTTYQGFKTADNLS